VAESEFLTIAKSSYISPAAEGERQLVDRLHKLTRVALIILVRMLCIEQFF
jgi:hypothetical protein